MLFLSFTKSIIFGIGLAIGSASVLFGSGTSTGKCTLWSGNDKEFKDKITISSPSDPSVAGVVSLVASADGPDPRVVVGSHDIESASDGSPVEISKKSVFSPGVYYKYSCNAKGVFKMEAQLYNRVKDSNNDNYYWQRLTMGSTTEPYKITLTPEIPNFCWCATVTYKSTNYHNTAIVLDLETLKSNYEFLNNSDIAIDYSNVLYNASVMFYQPDNHNNYLNELSTDAFFYLSRLNPPLFQLDGSNGMVYKSFSYGDTVPFLLVYFSATGVFFSKTSSNH